MQKYKNMRLAYRNRIMYTLGVCKKEQGSGYWPIDRTDRREYR